jgi:hypothetical protein
MTTEEIRELDSLVTSMHKMIEGDMEIDQKLIDRYNALCIKRRDTESH